MLHLLPEHQKEIVLAEYHKRLGVVMCLFVIGITVTGGVLLLPSYIVAQGKYSKVLQKKASIEAQLKQISSDDTGGAVKDVNNKIAALTPERKVNEASALFDRFDTLLRSNIKIEHYKYFVNTDGSITFVVDGIATNRDSLIAFADAVNKSGTFSGAVVPLSSLRSDKDVSFTFNLKVKNLESI
jgi:hypothetical protein